MSRQTNSIWVLPLVLGILCWLSIRDTAAILLIIVVVLLLLFADQELFRRPAKLPALNFSLRRLHHDGRQAVFQLTAAVKV